MAQATVSSKYQLVIPREIRREVPIESGQVLQVLAKGGVISLVPDRPLAAVRGMLRGIETTGFRDKSNRL